MSDPITTDYTKFPTLFGQKEQDRLKAVEQQNKEMVKLWQGEFSPQAWANTGVPEKAIRGAVEPGSFLNNIVRIAPPSWGFDWGTTPRTFIPQFEQNQAEYQDLLHRQQVTTLVPAIQDTLRLLAMDKTLFPTDKAALDEFFGLTKAGFTDEEIGWVAGYAQKVANTPIEQLISGETLGVQPITAEELINLGKYVEEQQISPSLILSTVAFSKNQEDINNALREAYPPQGAEISTQTRLEQIKQKYFSDVAAVTGKTPTTIDEASKMLADKIKEDGQPLVVGDNVTGVITTARLKGNNLVTTMDNKPVGYLSSDNITIYPINPLTGTALVTPADKQKVNTGILGLLQNSWKAWYTGSIEAGESIQLGSKVLDRSFIAGMASETQMYPKSLSLNKYELAQQRILDQSKKTKTQLLTEVDSQITQLRADNEEWKTANKDKLLEPGQGTYYDVLEALPSLLVGVSLTAIPYIGVPASAAFFTVQQAAGMDEQLRAMNVSPEDSSRLVGQYSAVMFAANLIPAAILHRVMSPTFSKVFGKTIEQEFIKNVGMAAGKQVAAGFIQTQISGQFYALMQTTIQNAYLRTVDETKNLFEGYGEAAKMMFWSMLPISVGISGRQYLGVRSYLDAKNKANVDKMVADLEEKGVSPDIAESAAIAEVAQTAMGKAALELAQDKAIMDLTPMNIYGLKPEDIRINQAGNLVYTDKSSGMILTAKSWEELNRQLTVIADVANPRNLTVVDGKYVYTDNKGKTFTGKTTTELTRSVIDGGGQPNEQIVKPVIEEQPVPETTVIPPNPEVVGKQTSEVIKPKSIPNNIRENIAEIKVDPAFKGYTDSTDAVTTWDEKTVMSTIHFPSQKIMDNPVTFGHELLESWYFYQTRVHELGELGKGYESLMKLKENIPNIRELIAKDMGGKLVDSKEWTAEMFGRYYAGQLDKSHPLYDFFKAEFGDITFPTIAETIKPKPVTETGEGGVPPNAQELSTMIEKEQTKPIIDLTQAKRKNIALLQSQIKGLDKEITKWRGMIAQHEQLMKGKDIVDQAHHQDSINNLNNLIQETQNTITKKQEQRNQINNIRYRTNPPIDYSSISDSNQQSVIDRLLHQYKDEQTNAVRKVELAPDASYDPDTGVLKLTYNKPEQWSSELAHELFHAQWDNIHQKFEPIADGAPELLKPLVKAGGTGLEELGAQAYEESITGLEPVLLPRSGISFNPATDLYKYTDPTRWQRAMDIIRDEGLIPENQPVSTINGGAFIPDIDKRPKLQDLAEEQQTEQAAVKSNPDIAMEILAHSVDSIKLQRDTGLKWNSSNEVQRKELLKAAKKLDRTVLAKSWGEMTNREHQFLTAANIPDGSLKMNLLLWESANTSQYLRKLQDLTGLPFHDIFVRIRSEYGIARKNYYDAMMDIALDPHFDEIRNSKEAKVRVGQELNARNPLQHIEHPEGLTDNERLMVDRIEEIYASYQPKVRYMRIIRTKSDIESLKREFPDAAENELQTVSDYMRVGDYKGLWDYQKPLTWGVIQHGYDPRTGTIPNLYPQEANIDNTRGESRLMHREVVDPTYTDKDVLQRLSTYIRQIESQWLMRDDLNALGDAWDVAKNKFNNGGEIEGGLKSFSREVQSMAYDRKAAERLIGRIYKQAMIPTFSYPTMLLRNFPQFLAMFPDRVELVRLAKEGFKPTKDPVFNAIAETYYKTSVNQLESLKTEFLFGQERLWTVTTKGGKEVHPLAVLEAVNRFNDKISLYTLTDNTPRHYSFNAALLKAMRATDQYVINHDLQKWMKNSGINNLLSSTEKNKALTYLAEGETKSSLGIPTLDNVSGYQKAGLFLAHEISDMTNNVYERPFRGIVELGSSGRNIFNLLVYPRGYIQRVAFDFDQAIRSAKEQGKVFTPETWHAAKDVFGLYVAGEITSLIIQKITGDTRRKAYSPLDLLSWTPGGLMLGSVTNLVKVIQDFSTALTPNQDPQVAEQALNSAITDIKTSNALLLPFYKAIVDAVDIHFDTKNIDSYGMRQLRAFFDKSYNPAKMQKVERNAQEIIQKIVFSTETAPPNKFDAAKQALVSDEDTLRQNQLQPDGTFYTIDKFLSSIKSKTKNFPPAMLSDENGWSPLVEFAFGTLDATKPYYDLPTIKDKIEWSHAHIQEMAAISFWGMPYTPFTYLNSPEDKQRQALQLQWFTEYNLSSNTHPRLDSYLSQ